MEKLRVFLESLNLKITREEASKTGRFLIAFILFYLVASFAFDVVFPGTTYQQNVASVTLGFLNLVGEQGSIEAGETVIINLQGNVSIEISQLCTGIIELLILVGAIIVSIGIEWKKRLLGALLGGIAVIVFNFLRIFITLVVILGQHPMEMVEFTHNFLFRVFLFITIAGIYCAWFMWAVRK